MARARPKKGYVSSLQGLVRVALVQAGMNREEELVLARKAARGDRSAQDRLIAAAAVMAEGYGKTQAKAYGLNADELISEGMVGLGMALRKFQPEKKIRFATYAIWWVRVYVDRFLKDYADNWESADGTRKVRFVSTQTKIGTDGDGDQETTVGDRLENPDEGGEVSYQDVEHRREIQAILETADLTEVERGIIRHRFMDDELTLEQLGARHGVSRERIRQLEIQLRPKLRKIFENAGEY